MGARQTALFITDSRSSCRELMEVARLLQASGAWACALSVVCDGVLDETEVAACGAEGIACVDMLGATYAPTRPREGRAPAHPGFRAMVRHSLQAFENALLEGISRSAVLASLARAARQRGIPLGWARTLLLRAFSALAEAGDFLARATASSRVRSTMLRLLRAQNLAWQVQRRRLQLAWARLLMRRLRPDLVLLCEDNVEGTSPLFIKAAHEAGAAVAILPNTIATAVEPAETYWDNPDHSLERWSNRLAAHLYPRWVYEHRGRRLLRLPAAGVLAVEWLGLAPPLPWQINSGAADAIVIESLAVERYFRRAGLPPQRLRRTGALSLDRLGAALSDAQARRARLCERLGLQPDRPLVLSALPPNQLDVRAGHCGFEDYDALLRFWVGSLAGAGDWNLVLNLHPRSREEDVRPLEGPRIRIAREPVIELIPLCDLFVASVSATIRWAIACGKPVLNFDVYRYGYDDYDGVAGVRTLTDPAAFADTARRLASEPELLADLARRQQACAAEWGELDGRSGGRMMRLFEELAATRRQETT